MHQALDDEIAHLAKAALHSLQGRFGKALDREFLSWRRLKRSRRWLLPL
jgi:hypothetical protein